MKLYKEKDLGTLVFSDEAVLTDLAWYGDERLFEIEVNGVTELYYQVNAELVSIYKEWCTQERLDWCMSINFEQYENRRKE